MNQKVMQSRIDLYKKIRHFFNERDVCEVETPILSVFGTTDIHINSFQTNFNNDTTCYLQTSPEFAMKRLLVDGYGDIFQICKVFRKEEYARYHHPEFNMLEWYRVGFDMNELMLEVGELLRFLSPKFSQLPIRSISYFELFKQHDINVFSDCFEVIKQKITKIVGYSPNLSESLDEWLDFMMVTVIEKDLSSDGFTFLYDYPPSQAALARVEVDSNGYLVAKRFELYCLGVEIANGFDELTNAKEQEQRFVLDQQIRQKMGKHVVAYDKNLIKALQKKMPACSGVAMGIDRILMLMINAEDISEVLYFRGDLENE